MHFTLCLSDAAAAAGSDGGAAAIFHLILTTSPAMNSLLLHIIYCGDLLCARCLLLLLLGVPGDAAA